jgi:hypothetical protein
VRRVATELWLLYTLEDLIETLVRGRRQLPGSFLLAEPHKK